MADLADAITDELIAGFGSLPNTFVIGRGAAFTSRTQATGFENGNAQAPCRARLGVGGIGGLRIARARPAAAWLVSVVPLDGRDRNCRHSPPALARVVRAPGALGAHPPGYYALLKALTPLFGESDFGLRLPSAIAGAAALLPVILFCRRFGTPTALMAALLVALAGTHVHYSQQARNYALLFLAFSTALLLADRLVAAATPRRRWALAGLLGVLGGAMEYLHTTAAFALVALNAYAVTVLAMERRLAAATLLPFMLADVLSLGLAGWWLCIAVEIATVPDNAVSWIERPNLAVLGAVLSRVLASPFPGASATLALSLHGGLLAFAALLAWRRREARAIGLLVGFVVGLALLFLVSQRIPVLLARTALFGLAFALPLSAWALLRLRPAWLAVAGGILLVGLQARSLADHYVDWARDNEPWRSAVRLIETTLAPGDRLLVLGSFEAFSIDHYGGPKLASATPVLVSTSDRLGIEVIRRLPRSELFTAESLDRLQDAAGLWMLWMPCPANEPATMQFSAALRARGWSGGARGDFGDLRLVYWTR